jgi:hypothetical protein
MFRGYEPAELRLQARDQTWQCAREGWARSGSAADTATLQLHASDNGCRGAFMIKKFYGRLDRSDLEYASQLSCHLDFVG